MEGRVSLIAHHLQLYYVQHITCQGSMTYSGDNDYDSTAPQGRDEDYYEWEAEMLTLEDLDTEVNESPATDAQIEEE